MILQGVDAVASTAEEIDGSSFADEFGPYTDRLDRSMEHLLTDLEALTKERSSLTLINADLHPAHIRLHEGRACLIDWEQCTFGTLYLDLPNAFSIETVLLYRDALARHGEEIPVPEFLERFHEIGRYMGLQYLETALLRWTLGGEARQKVRWFLYYTFALALHGR